MSANIRFPPTANIRQIECYELSPYLLSFCRFYQTRRARSR